jgi:serine/threonine protein kinase
MTSPEWTIEWVFVFILGLIGYGITSAIINYFKKRDSKPDNNPYIKIEPKQEKIPTDAEQDVRIPKIYDLPNTRVNNRADQHNSNHPNALRFGYQLQDYVVQEVLGQGSFGITYKAYDQRTQVLVAIKEYFPREFCARENSSTVLASGNRDDIDSFHWGLNKFLDEAKTLTCFNHPNLVKALRRFEANGTAYLVMEYCDGEPLDIILERERTLDEKFILNFLHHLLDALAIVHAHGIVHRDIKPGNIFIKRDGQPILIDFGAARQTLGNHSRSVTSLATRGYGAMEQYATRGKLGPWTDIYGLSATLYRCVTGAKPQDALDRQLEDELEPAATAAMRHYADDLLKAIDCGLKLRHELRPQSIDEFRGILLT